jgi:hypothetical protein
MPNHVNKSAHNKCVPLVRSSAQCVQLDFACWDSPLHGLDGDRWVDADEDSSRPQYCKFTVEQESFVRVSCHCNFRNGLLRPLHYDDT